VVSLTNAIDNLHSNLPVDRAALRARLMIAATLNEVEYTPESWARFVIARDAAQSVYDNPASMQAHINLARASLILAMDGLVRIPTAERAALRLMLLDARALNQVEYTAASWAGFAAALSTAQAVYDNPDSGAVSMNRAMMSLTIAMDNLVRTPPVERAALRARLAEAATLNQAEYTAASWASFVTARNTAQAVYDNPASNQVHINGALASLMIAINNLVRI